MAMSSEYAALRRTAGLFRRRDRGRLAVGGADRGEYLQGLLTNDIRGLARGVGCYAAYLTPQGRMLADMEVGNVSDHLLIDLHESVRELVAARFESLIFAEDVHVSDWTAGWDGLAVSGPLAGEVVASALTALAGDGAEPPAPGPPGHGCAQVSLGDAECIVMRTDPLGGPGLDLWVETHGTARLQSALGTAGGIEVGAAACEAVRIENGRPAFPVDMDGGTIPLEAGIETRALSFTKGCYVGQEVIVRILHRGQGRIARKLSGLECVGPLTVPFAAGTPLYRGAASVGHVTSSCVSPARGSVVALAYVARKFLDVGTELEVGPARRAVVVTALPMVESAALGAGSD